MVDQTQARLGSSRYQRTARRLVRILSVVEVSGRQYVPPDGPVIFAVNHCSWLDGPLVFGELGRPVTFLVKSEAFTLVLGTVLRAAGQIAVVRSRVDRGAVRAALRVLADSAAIGIFPEGSRGDGSVRYAKPGVGYFALRSGAVVVPVVCQGTTEAVRTLRRVPIRLTVGPPLELGHYPPTRPLNRRLVAAATEQVRVSLADLVRTAGAGRNGSPR